MRFQMHPSIVMAQPGKELVSVGAMSLGEGEGPWRGECRALDAAKVTAQAPLHTVSCDGEPVYTQ